MGFTGRYGARRRLRRTTRRGIMRDRVRLPEANMAMYVRGVAIDSTCTCLACRDHVC